MSKHWIALAICESLESTLVLRRCAPVTNCSSMLGAVGHSLTLTPRSTPLHPPITAAPHVSCAGQQVVIHSQLCLGINLSLKVYIISVPHQQLVTTLSPVVIIVLLNTIPAIISSCHYFFQTFAPQWAVKVNYW